MLFQSEVGKVCIVAVLVHVSIEVLVEILCSHNAYALRFGHVIPNKLGYVVFENLV